MKNVLLDLGGVVFESTGISSDVIDWQVVNKLNRKYGQQLDVGEDLFPAFVKDYNHLTKQLLDGITFLEEIWKTLSFNKELVDFLGQHYEIHICSDNYRENIDFVSHKFQFKDWVKSQHYSFDYKMTKANSEIFGQVLNKIGLKKDEIFFIDDSQNKVNSARNFGIQSFLYESNSQIIADVSKAFLTN